MRTSMIDASGGELVTRALKHEVATAVTSVGLYVPPYNLAIKHGAERYALSAQR
jgi:hypothetical protein